MALPVSIGLVEDPQEHCSEPLYLCPLNYPILQFVITEVRFRLGHHSFKYLDGAASLKFGGLNEIIQARILITKAQRQVR
jgi:hypothetical protein